MACAFVHRSDGIVGASIQNCENEERGNVIDWVGHGGGCYGHMVNTMLTDPPPWTCSYSHNLMCPTGLLI